MWRALRQKKHGILISDFRFQRVFFSSFIWCMCWVLTVQRSLLSLLRIVNLNWRLRLVWNIGKQKHFIAISSVFIFMNKSVLHESQALIFTRLSTVQNITFWSINFFCAKHIFRAYCWCGGKHITRCDIEVLKSFVIIKIQFVWMKMCIKKWAPAPAPIDKSCDFFLS